MPNYKLTYFDMDGGRGEPARILFHIGGIEFEDNRLSFSEFRETRNEYPFRCVPVLEFDGRKITQSLSINRYLGKLTGMYPEDTVQALFCDETMDTVEDISHHAIATFGLEGDALKKARAKLVDGWLSIYLKGIDALLERGGGEYFADGRLTVADLRVFIWTSALRSGVLDHVPTDLADTLAPGLVAHHERIVADERVVAYYQR